MSNKKTKKNEDWVFAETILKRGIRGFLAGFFGTAATFTFTSISSWTDLQLAIHNLALMAIVGGVSGLIMAVDKIVRWTE